MSGRRHISPFALVVLVLAAAYFLIPLIGTLLFSLNSNQTGSCCSLAAWHFVLHDGEFWSSLKTSLILALETIAISLALFVPTIYWVHLKLPKLRPFMALLALVPFVVPPIVLVVGLLDIFRGSPNWFYNTPYGFLVGAYVILAFPYMFFSLDAGFRAIDVHTLTEASHSLGAGWLRTLGTVILPNIRVAALSGSFLALAIVMGEFTIASLASFPTFPTYIQAVQETQAYGAAAVSLPELRPHLGRDAVAPPRGSRPPGPKPDAGSSLMAFLEIKGLRRVFGSFVALDGIDLELEQGEFVSLLGPSGCGKTTALRLVAGFDRPTAGTIVVDGTEMTGTPPNRRDMGMVFQAYSLFPNMTARQNVEFGLRVRRQSKGDRGDRVGELLELVGLGHAGDALPAPALGRHAAARRPRARPRDQAPHAPSRRAALGPRREGARAAARGDPPDPARARDHDPLRHPRPGGGARDLRPRRRPPRRPGRADRNADRDVLGTGDTLRGGVHRHDEPARGDGHRQLERADRARGRPLQVNEARGRSNGDRVLVLIRPEALTLTASANGDGPGVNAVTGDVLSHTFLGPVTRLKVVGPGGTLIADMPAARAEALPVGSRVVAHVPEEGVRLLTIAADAPTMNELVEEDL